MSCFGRVLTVVVDDQMVWGLHLCAAFLCDFEGGPSGGGGGGLHEMSLIWAVFKSNMSGFGVFYWKKSRFRAVFKHPTFLTFWRKTRCLVGGVGFLCGCFGLGTQTWGWLVTKVL